MNKTFLLLKCKSVDELFSFYDFTEGKQYKLIKKDGVDVYEVNLEDKNADNLIKMVKDIDIYIHNIAIYVSDYILCKTMPTQPIVNYINFFNVEQFFLPYISDQRVQMLLR